MSESIEQVLAKLPSEYTKSKKHNVNIKAAQRHYILSPSPHPSSFPGNVTETLTRKQNPRARPHWRHRRHGPQQARGFHPGGCAPREHAVGRAIIADPDPRAWRHRRGVPVAPRPAPPAGAPRGAQPRQHGRPSPRRRPLRRRLHCRRQPAGAHQAHGLCAARPGHRPHKGRAPFYIFRRRPRRPRRLRRSL